MIPPVSQQTHGHGKKSPDERERKNKKHFRKKEKKRDNNKYSGRCCEDMRAKGGEKKKKKTLTATVQEVFLEQGAVRAVWILSAMTARGAAGCSASAFVRPLALQNVAS